jgi:hypothetical protein
MCRAHRDLDGDEASASALRRASHHLPLLSRSVNDRDGSSFFDGAR